MQKISDSTNTANAAGEFTEGSPAAGVAATLLKAQWLNAIQRELINVLASAGLVPQPGTDTQLRQAIAKLANTAAESAASGKLDKVGGQVSGTLTLYNETTDSPDLRFNNTLWNAYIDLFQNQFRFIADQSGPVIYPLIFDLTAKTVSFFGNTAYHSGNFNPTTKADKATTLGGYGIADAYTKAQMDLTTNALANAVNSKLDKAGGALSGTLTMTNGSSVSPAIRMNNSYWNAYIDIFSNQLRLYVDNGQQGAPTSYPLVFDLTNKILALWGSSVLTEQNRPKNTIGFGANGWSRDADTGQLEVWGQASIEVPNTIGSVANLAVTFATNFAVEVNNVSFSLVAGDASEIVENIVGFYNLATSGMSISAKRVSGSQTGGEKITVHYRVTGR